MMDFNSNQFKLDNIRSTPSRPTIPYAQFPRPTLQDPEASFDGSTRSQHSDDEDSDATATSRGSFRSGSGTAMDSNAGSQHRRRTSISSKMQPGSKSQRPQSTPGGVPEEVSWSQDDDAWSADESKSTGDEHELSNLSDEDDLQDDEETGLTGKSKGKRKRRRRRNTLLDQRVVKESDISKEEKQEADQNVIKNMAINGLFIVLWYIFSLSISIYNKWMFSPEHLDFTFPLFTTCTHMLVQFSLASLVLYLFPRFRPRADSLSHPDSVYTPEEQRRHDVDAAEHKPLMTRWFYLTRLGPCGLSTGLDIGLGNMSLQFISLTFYTMCKSSSLAFVLMFAFLFHLETPSVKLIAIIATMTVGVVMMVAGEVDFSPLGFILVISAAFFSGFRWALTQILLLRNPATSNPFASIFFLAPIMFVSLLAIAIPVEGPRELVAGLGVLIDKKGPFMGPTILLAPGAIAFCMTASEFALLQRTSVVTLSIAGIFKEVVTILAAGRVFSDTMTAVNLGGLAVTIAAIAGYNYVKIRKMRQEAQLKAHLAHLGINGDEADNANEEDEDSDDDRGDSSKGKGAENQGLLGLRGGSPQG